jgi:hypothetical protein
MCSMVKGMPLSAMGRGLAASGYALSQVLFHAQHEGLPLPCEQRLRKGMARTVDKPTQMPGVPSALLTGSPKFGGFGVLPVGEQVAALQAECACRLLKALGVGQADHPDQLQGRPPAWVHLATVALKGVCPSLHPVQTLLLAGFSSAVDARQGRLTGLEAQSVLLPQGVLRNVTVGLQRLGRLEFHPEYAERPAEDAEEWLRLPDLGAEVVLNHAHNLVWQSQLGKSLVDALGPSRLQRVKDVRLMQMAGVERDRSEAHHAFAQHALRPSGLPQEQRKLLSGQFCKSFAQVWKIPWGNRHKEVLWRLAVNGVAGAGGHDLCHRQPCVCGYQLSDAQVRAEMGHLHRQHAFWDCPVAAAVRQELQRGLGAGVPLLQHHVWLLQVPDAAVQVAVWQVVGLAALEAMDRARRYMWWRFRQPGVSPAVALEAGIARARSLLWVGIQDFAAGGRSVPAGWERVPQDHCFLAVEAVVPLRPRVVIRLPP